MYYRVVEIKIDDESSEYLICYKDNPLIQPNLYLEDVGKNSNRTKKDYADILAAFFNYSEDYLNIKDYRKIKRVGALDTYINYKLYYKKFKDKKGNEDFIETNQTQITVNTANKYITVISNFYLRLDKIKLESIKIDEDFKERVENTKNKYRHKTKYSSLWSPKDISDLSIIKSDTKWKDKRKIKRTFEDEEINAIVENFTSLRDKCIFLYLLESGCRISECLHAKKKYFKIESDGTGSVYVDKSKTSLRALSIPDYLAKMIKKYIDTERQLVTDGLDRYEYLFVTSKGKRKGDRVQYAAFNRALKTAASKSGIDISKVFTHMCRSTKLTMMDIQNCSLKEIKRVSGNKTDESLKAYIALNLPQQAIRAKKYIYSLGGKEQ